jgi:hypothetical protein
LKTSVESPGKCPGFLFIPFLSHPCSALRDVPQGIPKHRYCRFKSDIYYLHLSHFQFLYLLVGALERISKRQISVIPELGDALRNIPKSDVKDNY